MFLVAVTGGMLTGKSSVLAIFKENGIPVIDVDIISVEILNPGKPGLKAIEKEFGNLVFKKGKLNPVLLNQMTDSEIIRGRRLNRTILRIVHREIIFQVFKHFMSGVSYVVMDLPLELQSRFLLNFFHKIITVTCDKDTLVTRVFMRLHLSIEDAKEYIEEKMPRQKICHRSDIVIEDSIENYDETEREVLQIISVLNASNQHWKVRFYIFAICVGIVALLWCLSLCIGQLF